MNVHDWLAPTRNGSVFDPPSWPTRGARGAVIDEVLRAVRSQGGGRLELWVHGWSADDDEGEFVSRGATPWRELWQMRCPLPAAAPAAAFTTRPFRDSDIAEFLLVNNRAFAWHPEQGGMTEADVRARMAEPWFRHEGFLLHHVGGRLAGFCWTKIHPADGTDPALGEIYVIAIDPDFHGRGLGLPMTLAGLQWLSRQGLTTGMLYVEHNNHSAVKTYRRIGFDVFRVDKAFELSVGA